MSVSIDLTSGKTTTTLNEYTGTNTLYNPDGITISYGFDGTYVYGGIGEDEDGDGEYDEIVYSGIANSGGLHSINLSRELTAGESVRLQWRNGYELIIYCDYEYADGDGTENPSEEGWYEYSDGEYVLSTDTEMETDDVYIIVTPDGTENPSEEGWYEYSNGEYVLSTDTEVDEDKAYYEAEERVSKVYYELKTRVKKVVGGTYQEIGKMPFTEITPVFHNYEGILDINSEFSAVTPDGTENPSEEGWYELDESYVLSTDTEVDSSKTYYELSETLYEYDDDEFVATEDTEFNSNKTYYIDLGPKYTYYEFNDTTNKYVVTSDTEIDSTKTYYLRESREQENTCPLFEDDVYTKRFDYIETKNYQEF